LPSSTNDAVQFFVLRTEKGELQAPEYNWSVERFEQAFNNLFDCATETRVLSQQLTNINLSIDALAAAFLTPLPPTEEPLGIGSLGLLSLPPEADRTSETMPATDQTDAQTPPSQRE
jgi:hypothetical protein